MKHASATRVEISIRVEQDKLVMEVKDDGIGFPELTVSNGYGLKGMRERVANLSGIIDIVSSEGFGTTVTVTMPYTPGG
jgi:two-component system sensor histidine kinase DegS